MSTWVIVTNPKFTGSLAAAAALGDYRAVVLGDANLAAAVAGKGAAVTHIPVAEGCLPDSYAAAVAELLAAATTVFVSDSPCGRALLAAVAAKVGAAIIPGVLKVTRSGEEATIERQFIGGEAIETLQVSGSLAAIFAGEETDLPAGSGVVETLSANPAGLRAIGIAEAGSSSGLADAARVVSVGRGVKSKDDIAIVQALADALGAEIACSMPVADDLGWIPKERYVGRSGQQIAPTIYIAVGIDGAPQHMEGVRDAKYVVAINNNPEARIFRVADLGIVGDLYEVVPALTAAVK